MDCSRGWHPARQLAGFSEETLLDDAAVSPSGRRVASAFWFGRGEKTLQVWDLETGEHWRFELPPPEHSRSEGVPQDGGIYELAFADESTLYTAGDGGLRRWRLSDGTNDLVAAASPGYWMKGAFSADGRVALAWESMTLSQEQRPPQLYDLAAGTSRQLTQGGTDLTAVALDPSGTVWATGGHDGIVRLGRVSGGEAQLLVGHRGVIDKIEISADLRWVGTTGQDQTLRLWPMPDFSKPPLHTLPHDELVAKLHSLTNLRVVKDGSSPDGWRVEVGPFPGWRNVPAWSRR